MKLKEQIGNIKYDMVVRGMHHTAEEDSMIEAAHLNKTIELEERIEMIENTPLEIAKINKGTTCQRYFARYDDNARLKLAPKRITEPDELLGYFEVKIIPIMKR